MTAAERDQGQAERRRKRRHVKVDPYAMFDLIREHHLTSSEWPLLHAVTMLADFRSQEWHGTLGELAQYTRMSTRTISDAFQRMTALGLLETVNPFGPNTQGTLRISAYDLLVVAEQRRMRRLDDRGAEPDDSNSLREAAQTGGASRRTSARSASFDAIEQPKHPHARREAVRERRWAAQEVSGEVLEADGDKWDPHAPLPWETKEVATWTSKR